MSRYILVLGASSDMAKAIIRRYAKENYNFYLAGRNVEELQKDATDLAIRYNVQALPVHFDMTALDEHTSFYRSLEPKPVGTICVAGYLGDQKKAEISLEETNRIIATNYTGCVSILNVIANHYEVHKQGFIIGISSVAGDRGRASNYMYGSAKAGFTAYLSGLRNRLFKSGVQVLTVKPGFVNTKMTEGLPLNPLLTAQPDEVAEDIYKAQVNGADIIYTKWFWRFIMLIIVAIPEKIFKKLNL